MAKKKKTPLPTLHAKLFTRAELVARIQTYRFKCPGGPLANCVEWIELQQRVASDAHTTAAMRLACEFGFRQSEKGHNLERTLELFDEATR